MALLLVQVYALYLPAPGPDAGFPYADKLLHVAMFAAPAAVATRMRLRWPFVVLVLHAVISEPLQAWLTATRQSDGWDVVADLLGIVIGMAVVRRSETRARPPGADAGAR